MKSKNIYQIAREGSGLTQERASEYLNISKDTLASYENERRNVPDDIAVAMSELYDFKLLSYQHLRLKEAGRCLPHVEERSLSQAVIMLLQSLEEIENLKSSLLQIADDNEVTGDEKEEFEKIINSVEKLQKCCLTLKYCKGKEEH